MQLDCGSLRCTQMGVDGHWRRTCKLKKFNHSVVAPLDHVKAQNCQKKGLLYLHVYYSEPMIL